MFQINNNRFCRQFTRKQPRVKPRTKKKCSNSHGGSCGNTKKNWSRAYYDLIPQHNRISEKVYLRKKSIMQLRCRQETNVGFCKSTESKKFTTCRCINSHRCSNPYSELQRNVSNAAHGRLLPRPSLLIFPVYVKFINIIGY